jgi:hypothetical protein
VQTLARGVKVRSLLDGQTGARPWQPPQFPNFNVFFFFACLRSTGADGHRSQTEQQPSRAPPSWGEVENHALCPSAPVERRQATLHFTAFLPVRVKLFIQHWYNTLLVSGTNVHQACWSQTEQQPSRAPPSWGEVENHALCPSAPVERRHGAR